MVRVLQTPTFKRAVKRLHKQQKRELDEAVRCKAEGTSRAILFNLCGHGYFDMQAYSDFASGKLYDQPYDESEVAMTLAGLPSVA